MLNLVCTSTFECISAALLLMVNSLIPRVSASGVYSGQKAWFFCASLQEFHFLGRGSQNIEDLIFAMIPTKYWPEAGVMTSFLLKYVLDYEN